MNKPEAISYLLKGDYRAQDVGLWDLGGASGCGVTQACLSLAVGIYIYI